MPAKKKKVNTIKKAVSKKRPGKKNRIVPKAENGIVPEDIVYVNGTGKPNNGRPPKYAKLSQIRSLAAIDCTEREIAYIVGMNPDTFTDLKKNNPIVAEVIASGRCEGDGSIRRKQHEVAMRGDTTMLKWLGKNRLNQSERILQHTEISNGDEIKMMLSNAIDKADIDE